MELVDVDVAACSRCGCTDDAPCWGGCIWVDTGTMEDVCSSCATRQELAGARRLA